VRSIRNTTTTFAAALLVAAVVLISGSAGTAHAADNGAWSVFPTPLPGESAPRLYFTPYLHAGVPYSDSVTLTNKTSGRLHMNFYAADAVLTPQGDFSLRRRTDPKVGVAAWIKLPYEIIDLAPHSELVVSFTIDPPRDAPSGDAPGGIVLEMTNGSFSRSGQLGVSVLQAVAARIYARVAGPLRPSLRVETLRVHPRGSWVGAVGAPVDVTESFIVENTGNEILAPTEHSTLEPLFGSKISSKSEQLPQLLPHSRLAVTHVFKSVEPFLYVRAHAYVAAPGASASASGSALVLPWILLAVILALIGYAGFRLWRRRRGEPSPDSPALARPGSSPPGGAEAAVQDLVDVDD